MADKRLLRELALPLLRDLAEADPCLWHPASGPRLGGTRGSWECRHCEAPVDVGHEGDPLDLQLGPELHEHDCVWRLAWTLLHSLPEDTLEEVAG